LLLSVFVLEAWVAVSIAIMGEPPSASIFQTYFPRSSKAKLYPGDLPTPMELIAHFLIIFGVHFRLWSQRVLGRHFTFELALLNEHKLITHGPYAYVRHPGYTGSLLSALGVVLFPLARGTLLHEVTGTQWKQIFDVVYTAVVGLMVFVGFFSVRRSNIEDQMLKDGFGKEWDAWAANTKYKLIPFLF
jgi:protein-S-isoprenylcysteine O-methyltransferase Ste14